MTWIASCDTIDGHTVPIVGSKSKTDLQLKLTRWEKSTRDNSFWNHGSIKVTYSKHLGDTGIPFVEALRRAGIVPY